MTQQIKVQDGKLVYGNTDPQLPVDVDVIGNVHIQNAFTIGSAIFEDATITTADALVAPGADLEITTGTNGSLSIHQNSTGGTLLLNNVQWPTGVVQPVPGMFIGATALNTLEYMPFVIAFNPSDVLTVLDLNNLYPGATPGQSVIGTTVIYQCVGVDDWRILGQPIPPVPPPVSSVPQTLVVRLTATSPSPMNGYENYGWAGSTLVESNEAYWDDYTSTVVIPDNGPWRVTVHTRMNKVDGEPWPITPIAYGTVVYGTVSSHSQYYKSFMEGDVFSNTLSYTPQWHDEFIIADPGTLNINISAYAFTELGENFNMICTSVVTVTRIFGTVPPPV